MSCTVPSLGHAAAQGTLSAPLPSPAYSADRDIDDETMQRFNIQPEDGSSKSI